MTKTKTPICNESKAPNVNPNNSIIIVCDQVETDFSNIGVLYSLAPSVNIGSVACRRPRSIQPVGADAWT